MSENYYLGVDVGTGSVRGALVKLNGEIVRTATCPIKTWTPQRDFYEQSSDDIWKACCQVIKTVAAKVNPSSIKGIGFDATCSLVCIGKNNQPLTVSPTGSDEQNVILWSDHRAKSQAEFINKHKPKILKYVGGKISLEMETPKLMWIKQNLKRTWDEAKYFFDLVDFLTWKATGDDCRSLCTVVCKWAFVATKGKITGWDKDYFSLIGLDDLLEDDAIKIGRDVKNPGEKCGAGLTKAAAKELNLLPGTCVATGLIDAHAGGLGLLTSHTPGVDALESKIGLICGTSTCHMALNFSSITVPGVWGPYFSAMVPGMYLNEAGQSATGKLIDFVINNHPAMASLKSRMTNQIQVYEYLNNLLDKMASARGLKSPAVLTNKLHIWPDFHGNRSPLADSSLLGMMSGLALVGDEEDLAVKYLATVQALAYGTRHIFDTLKGHGYKQFSTVLICGGLSKNKLFVQVNADVLGVPVYLPKVSEPVLLGAAILGVVAAEGWKNIQEALQSMKGPSETFIPFKEDKRYHDRKYRVFLKMVEDQKSYNAIMGDLNT